MSLQGKRFLVTGGTGFIGSALCNLLASKGAKVRSFDNDHRGRSDRLSPTVVRLKGDIRRLADVQDAVRGVDCVCHLAAINGTEFFYKKPDLVLEVGTKGMTNVIDACKSEDVPELIVASSSEVYQTPPEIPTSESAPLSVPDPTNPRFSYGGSKIISELLSLHWASTLLERVCIFRPHNVYGPDMGFEHVVPQLSQRIAGMSPRSRKLPIQGDGKETRAFIYIDDAAEAIIRIIEAGEHKAIYHIGTQQEVSIRELAGMIGEVLGRKIDVSPGPLTEGSTRRRCPNIKKLTELGFKPTYSLREGLEKTVPWYANQLTPTQRDLVQPRT